MDTKQTAYEKIRNFAIHYQGYVQARISWSERTFPVHYKIVEVWLPEYHTTVGIKYKVLNKSEARSANVSDINYDIKKQLREDLKTITDYNDFYMDQILD